MILPTLRTVMPRGARTSLARAINTSAVRRSGGDHPPKIYQGPGAAPGTVATDEEQSTGLERLDLMGRLAGVDIFDMKPLDASRTGTMKDPIVLQSMYPSRFIGCTGSPAGSHDTLWLTLKREKEVTRCIECGSVYKMDYIGPEDDGHGHH